MADETTMDLLRINEELIVRENDGDRNYFEERLAPKFVLRRANGEFQDRDCFLNALCAGGERMCDSSSIRIEWVDAFRALVTCVVVIRERTIHNARLFARNPGGKWQLVAWVNEAVQS